MKTKHPKIDINRLREIGWSQWDPIGLSSLEGDWKGQPFEDEYDSYLMKVAGMLRNQCELSEVVDYLFFIESEHMGLGPPINESQFRAELLELVQTISDDPLIWRNRQTR